MKRVILIMIAICMTFMSCEKRDYIKDTNASTGGKNDPGSNLNPRNRYEIEIEKFTGAPFELEDPDIVLQGGRLDRTGEYLFVNGELDGKLYLNVFKKDTPKRIFKYISEEKLIREWEKDLGYGEKEKHIVGPYELRDYPVKIGDKYIFTLFAMGANYSDIVRSVLYFVSKESAKHIYNPENQSFTHLKSRKWYKNHVLIESFRTDYSTSLNYYVTCYSDTGEKMFQLPYSYGSCISEYERGLPIGVDKQITSNDFGFSCKDIRKDNTIWESKSLFPNETHKVEFNNTVFSEIDSETTQCITDYTLYSGEKGTITCIIDNNTGAVTIKK